MKLKSPSPYNDLKSQTVAATERALASGSLLPIATESIFIREGEVDFLIRRVSNLQRKAKAKKLGGQNDKKKTANPFLPYEKSMLVRELSEKHVCLLNKFNVIEHHLLIVTRDYESQDRLLTREDFRAALKCLADIRGLCFYNGGEEAGASQHHKHLQLIPLPMLESGPDVPIEPLLDRALTTGFQPTRIPALEFVHTAAKLKELSTASWEQAPQKLYSLYRTMLEETGLNLVKEAEDSLQRAPYNLLFTRDWMLLIPRSKEHWNGISMNALAYAGALLVQNERQMDALKKSGPMQAIVSTAVKPL